MGSSGLPTSKQHVLSCASLSQRVDLDKLATSDKTEARLY